MQWHFGTPARWKSSAKAWRQWLSTHEKVLSLIGLLIVAATFVVKEIVLEDKKDQLEDILSKRREYILADDFNDMSSKVGNVDDAVLNLDRFKNDSVRASLNNLDRRNNQNSTRCIDIISFADTLNTYEVSEASGLIEACGKLIRQSGGSDLEEIKKKNGGPDEINKADLEMKSRQRKVETIRGQLLWACNSEYTRRSDQIRFWTIIGNIFYILGWGLTFVSKALGLKVDDAGDAGDAGDA